VGVRGARAWNDHVIGHWLASDQPAVVAADGSWTGDELSARFKLPTIFDIVDALPRHPNGKLSRHELVCRRS
jgi:acyl-CoA synthetase (AMP-forming)/AMP-acid ligase II